MQPSVGLPSTIYRTEREKLNDSFAAELSAEELVKKYSPMIYRLAYSRLQNTADAEDITQEVLMKYIRSGQRFESEEHRRRWLLRVAVNAIKSLATTAWRRHTVSLDEAAEVGSESSDIRHAEIRDAVQKLPEKYRMPIHLFYFEDLSVKEIASIMSSGEGTIKSLLSRARDKLREMLTEE